MARIGRGIAGAAMLAGMVSFALPLAAATGPGQQTPTIVKNVNTVPLVFIALDKHHHFVPGLTAKDIQILDNGKPQKVQQFNAEGNLPLRIAILMDISNSVTTRFQFEQKAAADFLASVLVEGRDEAMVAGFDNTLHVVQPFTDKYEKLQQAISRLRPSGGTALYDALFYTSHDDFGSGLKGSGQGRNIIVIISDGTDNQSRYSRDEALGMAQDVGAVIYTIGTEPTGADGEADGVLKRFANQTGGQAFFPIEARDLGGAFQSILNDLRHQYVVAYNPDNFVPNGQFHEVEIKVLRKDVTVRTRKGYFARSTGAGQ
ncbi:MAG TPA: VWA domain-containing protein [Terriglobales bacterium]|nr:VWA domain-containing protein [Terriglobales bacterium]